MKIIVVKSDTKQDENEMEGAKQTVKLWNMLAN